MSQSTKTPSKPSTDPLKLTASAVNYLLYDTTEGNSLLHRDCLSRDDDWAFGAIPLAVWREQFSPSVFHPLMGMASGRAGILSEEKCLWTSFLTVPKVCV